MASGRTEFHVVPYNDSWQIKRNGLPVFEFPTKNAAVDKAAAEARLAHPAQVVIHMSDGRIEEERTYESDPLPPKG